MMEEEYIAGVKELVLELNEGINVLSDMGINVKITQEATTFTFTKSGHVDMQSNVTCTIWREY